MTIRCFSFLLFLTTTCWAFGDGITYGGYAPLTEEEISVKLGFEPVCTNQLCATQDTCCPGTVCVAYRSSKIGICAKPLAQPEGTVCLTTARGDPHCRRDLECRPIHKDFQPLGLCVNVNRVPVKKKYFDPCERTIECDTQQQLCCRAQRSPGRTTNRKICSYFDDPLEQCIF